MLQIQSLLAGLSDLNSDNTAEFLNGSRLFFGDDSNRYLSGGLTDFSGTVFDTGDINTDGIPDILSVSSDRDIYVYSMESVVQAPAINIEQPTDLQTVNQSDISVIGSVKGSVTAFTICGISANIDAQGNFSVQRSLINGENNIEVIAESADGYISKRTVRVTANISALTVTIDSVLNLNTDLSSVEITGTVSDPDTLVLINSVPADLSGNTFSATLDLTSETSMTAVATNDHNQVATHVVSTKNIALNTQTIITGIVTDTQSNPIAGANLLLTDSQSNSTSFTADASGGYTFNGSIADTFTLRCTATGYKPQESSFSFLLGQTQFFDFSLEAVQPLVISIESHQEGATVHDASIGVWGDISDDQTTTVSVDGLEAYVGNGRFSAIVPVVSGNNTITVTATDIYSQTATDSVNIIADFILPEITFSATPSDIQAGDLCDLVWTTQYADSVSIEPGIGPVSLDSEGPLRLYPNETTTYTITATGPGGSASKTATVTVTPVLPVITFQSSQSSILQGESATLTWTTSFADTVTIDNGIGEVNLNDFITVSPTSTTTYTITATGPGGTETQSTTITVTVPPPATIILSADSTQILDGQSTNIHWTATNATTVTVDQEIGDVDPVSGTINLTLNTTITLTFTAQGFGGTAIETITIEVFPMPVVSFQAVPTIISPGHATKLKWNVTNALSVSIDGIGAVDAVSSLMESPAESRTYTLRAKTLVSNLTYIGTINVTVSDTAPPYLYFSASPTTIQPGEEVELSWYHNYDTTTIDQGIDSVSSSGTLIVTPDETTTYTLQVNDPLHGTGSRSVTITVEAEPTATLSASPDTITEGESTTLSWTSLRADTVTIDNGIGEVQKNDSVTVTPTQTTTYTITAANTYGSVEENIVVTVYAVPVVNFQVEPDIISPGESSTLTWNVNNATDISIDNSLGTVTANDSTIVTPAQTTTYTLTATGLGGTVQQSVTVEVSPISLTIVTPADSAVIDRYKIMVQGTISNAAETGVTVNGIIAVIDGNLFTANHVPLEDGENTITAVATDINDNSISISHTVTVQDVQDYISISSFPESGISPFEATISVDATFDFSTSNIYYSGPDNVDFLSSTNNEDQIRITTPGVYYFTVEITDDQANVHSDSMAIEVLDPVVLDTLLKNKWDGMKSAMVSGDIEHAVTYFIERARDKYRTLMQEITDLPAFANNMEDIEMIYYNSGIAKYRIHRTEDVNGTPTPITYYIYFTRDMDGMYKIYKF